VPITTFGGKPDITDNCRKYRNLDLQNLYSSQNNFSVDKPRIIRWVWTMESLGKNRNA